MAKKIRPTVTGLGRPLGMYPNRINQLVRDFLERGFHISHTGGTLWPILEYCHREAVGYSLHWRPRTGYSVTIRGEPK